MKIEVGKKYLTRSGSVATVVAHNPDADAYHQYIGWVDGIAESWSEGGRFQPVGSGADDLIRPATERVTKWGTHYSNGKHASTYWYNSEAVAKAEAGRIALLRCDFEDGIPVPGTLEVIK